MIIKDVYTEEEVIELLQEIQQDALDSSARSLIVGCFSQTWVIQELIGERIVALGGTEIPYTIEGVS